MSGQLKGIVGWFKTPKASQFEQNNEQQPILQQNPPNDQSLQSQQISVDQSDDSCDQSKIDQSNLKEVQLLINKLRSKNKQLSQDKDQQARSLNIMIQKLYEQDIVQKELQQKNQELERQLQFIQKTSVSNSNEGSNLQTNLLLNQIAEQQTQLDQLKQQVELKDQLLQLKNNEELQQSRSEIFKSCLQGEENSLISQNLQESSTQTFEILEDLSYNASNSRDISTQTVEQQTNTIHEQQTNTVNEISPTKTVQKELSESIKNQQSSERNQFATTVDTNKSESKKEIQQFSNPFSEQSTNQDDSFVKENSILNVSTEEIDQEIHVNAQIPKLVEAFNSQIFQSSIMKIDQSNFTNPSMFNVMLSQIQDQNEKFQDLKQSPYILPENQKHNIQPQTKQLINEEQQPSSNNYSNYLRSGGQLQGSQHQQNFQQAQKQIDIDAQQKQLKQKQEEKSIIQQKQLEEALEKQNQILQQKMLKQKQLTQKSLDPYRNMFPKNEIFDVFNSEQIHEGFSLITTLKQTGLSLTFRAPKVNPRYETKFLQVLQILDIVECRNQCKARLYFVSEKTIYESFDEKEIYYRHDYEAITVFREMCKANKKAIFICFMVSSKSKFYFQDPEKRTLKLKSADQVYPLLLCHQKGI